MSNINASKVKSLQKIKIHLFHKKTNRRTMISAHCSVCNSKKDRFIKKQETKWLLSDFGWKTLFKYYSSTWQYIVLIGLNIVIGKNCFNPDVIIKTFKLLLKMLILSKNYDELHIILNNKKHEWNSKCFFKAGEKYMPEVHLWKQRLQIVLVDNLPKTKK